MIMFGASDTIEGIGDIQAAISRQGLNQMSYNPVRESVFGGNETAYTLTEMGVSFVFDVITGMAVAKMPTRLKTPAQAFRATSAAGVATEASVSREAESGAKSTLKPNLQLFARKGQEIVGTEFSEIKPTQLEINPERVQYYIDKIKSGKKLDPIPVINVEGKGKFLLEGHHRYVASKMMGVEIDIIETQGKGPIGLKNWSQVEWTEWNGLDWVYK